MSVVLVVLCFLRLDVVVVINVKGGCFVCLSKV